VKGFFMHIKKFTWYIAFSFLTTSLFSICASMFGDNTREANMDSKALWNLLNGAGFLIGLATGALMKIDPQY
jgi:hypothetical protein